MVVSTWYARQIGNHFPKDRGEHKKYLSCHHLVYHISTSHIFPPNKNKPPQVTDFRFGRPALRFVTDPDRLDGGFQARPNGASRPGESVQHDTASIHVSRMASKHLPRLKMVFIWSPETCLLNTVKTSGSIWKTRVWYIYQGENHTNQPKVGKYIIQVHTAMVWVIAETLHGMVWYGIPGTQPWPLFWLEFRLCFEGFTVFTCKK